MYKDNFASYEELEAFLKLISKYVENSMFKEAIWYTDCGTMEYDELYGLLIPLYEHSEDLCISFDGGSGDIYVDGYLVASCIMDDESIKAYVIEKDLGCSYDRAEELLCNGTFVMELEDLKENYESYMDEWFGNDNWDDEEREQQRQHYRDIINGKSIHPVDGSIAEVLGKQWLIEYSL